MRDTRMEDPLKLLDLIGIRIERKRRILSVSRASILNHWRSQWMSASAEIRRRAESSLGASDDYYLIHSATTSSSNRMYALAGCRQACEDAQQ